jgi:hypothetical protein
LTRILAAALLSLIVTTAVQLEVTPKPAKAEPSGTWTEAPEYARLFAPSGPRAAAYHFYVSRLGITDVVARLEAEPSLLHPPGAWMPAALLPSDAFGQTGGYDRSKLARLYGSTRAVVAHGPRAPSTRGAGSSIASGASSEAWTLVSPYPSPDMTRLEPGTMLIVLNLQLP